MDEIQFTTEFRASLLQLFAWRRDVRRFKPERLPDSTLQRLIEICSLAPSVGLSEPWRFVIVEDEDRRAAVRASFEQCNAEALARQASERAARYARLKLEGLSEAPSQFAVFADTGTSQGHGLGRLTMPNSTIEYSAVMAVHMLWLAARAEGIGLGWVSILDPAAMARILDVPPAWTFIGYFCLGYAAGDSDTPTLERDGWEKRRKPAASIICR